MSALGKRRRGNTQSGRSGRPAMASVPMYHPRPFSDAELMAAYDQVMPMAVSAASRAGSRAPQPEKKGMDTPLTIGTVLTTTNTNGDILPVNLIQQGTGSWNRVGRKVHLKSLRIRAVVKAVVNQDQTTGEIYSGAVRMVVVWDKQPSGAALPSFDTIFGKTSQAGTESTTYLDPIRYDTMDRFQILRDKFIQMNPGVYPDTQIGGGSNVYVMYDKFEEYIKLGAAKETLFSGQSSPMTIADINSGALYVIFRADAQTVSVNITADSYARLRYTD